ncbi:GNAT family N-acetyltransferase [Marinomonas sp. THO17]|uniref:GNAT family N-acetyltransferase n=1 Tax=Marinomonas sp. THO17 TaxID=3149048 RepID=UPI00336BD43D
MAIEHALLNIIKIDAETTLPLRQQVLWPNKSQQECRVNVDDMGQHYGVYLDEKLLCVASVFIDGQSARLRKFATLVEYQRQGIGQFVLSRILDDLKQIGVKVFWCDARESASSLYQRFGMTAASERFYKGDIAYRKMSMNLK